MAGGAAATVGPGWAQRTLTLAVTERLASLAGVVVLSAADGLVVAELEEGGRPRAAGGGPPIPSARGCAASRCAAPTSVSASPPWSEGCRAGARWMRRPRSRPEVPDERGPLPIRRRAAPWRDPR